MSRPRPPKLMGTREVADLVGCPRSTVSAWVHRNAAGLPPYADLAAGPVWRERDIRAWLVATGRLDAQPSSN